MNREGLNRILSSANKWVNIKTVILLSQKLEKMSKTVSIQCSISASWRIFNKTIILRKIITKEKGAQPLMSQWVTMLNLMRNYKFLHPIKMIPQDQFTMLMDTLKTPLCVVPPLSSYLVAKILLLIGKNLPMRKTSTQIKYKKRSNNPWSASRIRKSRKTVKFHKMWARRERIQT
jgi:hypothetical protein